MDVFFDDLQALRETPQTLPYTTMRLRWKRSWLEAPLHSANKRHSNVTLFLYDAASTPTSRPLWRCDIDSCAPVETIEQGSTCDVRGVLGAGRGIAVQVGDTQFMATYPISHPLRGPRLGG